MADELAVVRVGEATRQDFGSASGSGGRPGVVVMPMASYALRLAVATGGHGSAVRVEV